ncbi:LytR C-terminal domain-containing protein [Longivirga aurantiaca]|uniref:LytR C-terminal domain-containing protein n=1 Tax=Longivirga aurantiaca TaxID=1837743 RepID=A0ABW1SVZ8_9ACTN
MTTNGDDPGTGARPQPGTPPDPTPSGPEDVLPARPPGRRAKPPVEGTPSPLGRVLLPVALLVVAVVAVLAAWGRLQADESVVAGGPTSPAASPTSSSSSSPSPSSSSPTPKPSKTTTPTPTPSDTPTESPSPTAVVIDRSVPVTVLNGTRRTGLAAKVAADLKSKGWTVVSIGNWRGGGVDTTTVFVDGRDDAAATMRRDLKAADATEEPIGAMRTNRITVVIMDDYPTS